MIFKPDTSIVGKKPIASSTSSRVGIANLRHETGLPQIIRLSFSWIRYSEAEIHPIKNALLRH